LTVPHRPAQAGPRPYRFGAGRQISG